MLATIWGWRAMIEREIVDVIQPDTGRAGGISQMKKLAGMAEAHHIMMAPHSGTLGPVAEFAALHLLAAIPNTLMLERIENDWPGRNDGHLRRRRFSRTAICWCRPRRASASTSMRRPIARHPSERNVSIAGGGYEPGTEGEYVYVQTRFRRAAYLGRRKTKS